MSSYDKPLPLVDRQSQPYWEALRANEIRIPRCKQCLRFRMNFDRWCPHCQSDEFEWTKVSGKGAVWSQCEFHRSYFEGFDLPYGVALVRLDVGVLVMTNIIETLYSEIEIGMPVEPVFEPVTSVITLLKFRRARDLERSEVGSS